MINGTGSVRIDEKRKNLCPRLCGNLRFSLPRLRLGHITRCVRFAPLTKIALSGNFFYPQNVIRKRFS